MYVRMYVFFSVDSSAPKEKKHGDRWCACSKYPLLSAVLIELRQTCTDVAVRSPSIVFTLSLMVCPGSGSGSGSVSGYDRTIFVDFVSHVYSRAASVMKTTKATTAASDPVP